MTESINKDDLLGMDHEEIDRSFLTNLLNEILQRLATLENLVVVTVPK